MELVIDGKKYDLSGALPLTLGDLRKLKSLNVSLGSSKTDFGDPDVLAALITTLLQKVETGITDDIVNRITVAQLNQIGTMLSEEMGNVDHPT